MAGAKSYQELVAWQLAYELEQEVFALTATGRVAKDFKFEGFARFRPTEFTPFLIIARGSLTETHHHLLSGKDRGYFSPADHDRLARLAGRAAIATTRLIRYLRSEEARHKGFKRF